MAESANLANLKEAYRDWHETKGESVDTWASLYADDICIESVSKGGSGLNFAGICEGKQDAIKYLTAILDEWEMIHWTPEIFVEDGDRVAMFGHCAWTHRKTGKQAEVEVAHLWRFEDGKAVEYHEVFDSAQAVAAATPDQD